MKNTCNSHLMTFQNGVKYKLIKCSLATREKMRRGSRLIKKKIPGLDYKAPCSVLQIPQSMMRVL